MKQEFLHMKILKIVIGIIIGFFAVFVYSFMSSRGTDSDISPEAYGYDSIEYIAEPVMKICVWQRNDRRHEDYPDESAHSHMFYDAVPLEMKEGAAVSTNVNPISYDTDGEFAGRRYVNTADDLCLTVTFEGNIVGKYDEILDLYYGSDLETWPNGIITNENGQARGTGGTFAKPEGIILSFHSQLFALAGLELDNLYEESRSLYEKLINEKELRTGLKYKNFYKTESYTDVYPDADEKWNVLERGVLTSYVTVQGIDPLKPETVLAEAVLEIKSYSGWLIENLRSDLLDEFCRTMTDNPCTVVTVISYTQSEKFAVQ